MGTQIKEQVIAREFVTSLQEQAFETLEKCLEKLQAPEPVKALVQSINSLNHFLANPDFPEENWGPERFDMPTVITETINNIAASGGTFAGAETISAPREGTLLA